MLHFNSLLRLLRMLRALSIIRKIKETASKKQKWFPPVRYNTMSEHEVNFFLKLSLLSNKTLLNFINQDSDYLLYFEDINNTLQ